MKQKKRFFVSFFLCKVFLKDIGAVHLSSLIFLTLFLSQIKEHTLKKQTEMKEQTNNKKNVMGRADSWKGPWCMTSNDFSLSAVLCF